MKAFINLNLLRWSWRLFLIWLTVSAERVLGLPILSLIILSNLTRVETGWRRYALILISSCFLSAVFMWSLPLTIILVWSLYFWLKYGDSILASRTLRSLIGGWVGVGLIFLLSGNLWQSQQFFYLIGVSLIVVLWLKGRQVWQLKNNL